MRNTKMNIFLFLRFTLHEAIRRRLFLAVLILSAIGLILFAFMLNVAVDLLISNNHQSSVEFQRELTTLGVIMSILTGWVVYLMTCILTIVMSAGIISSEREAGTFSVIVPKPVHRVEILIGKWLGYFLLLTGYTLLMCFGFFGIIFWRTGYWPSGWFLAFGMIELIILTLLGLTTLGSTFLPTVSNGAISILLFVFAPISSFVQFVVKNIALQESTTLSNVGIVVNLLIPTDALWRGASYYLLPPILGLAGNAIDTPFTSGTPVAPAFFVWVIAYSVILPLLAIWRFQRSDL
jgi:ABC-type transport system involved in multi-copper enzyme maturation permease subunit